MKTLIPRTRNHGFTLVEIAIILVIIALVIVVIVISQDMVHTSKIRKIITQLDRYSASVNAFYLKYNGLPGDLKTAVEFGLGSASCPNPVTKPPRYPGCSGDGNFYLTSDTEEQENINFWYHLWRARMIDGTFDGLTVTFGNGAPKTSLRDVGLYSATLTTLNNSSVFVIGLNDVPGFTDYLLRPQEAFILDSKMDDGRPTSGVMQHLVPGAVLADCVDIAISQYNVDNEDTTCVIYSMWR